MDQPKTLARLAADITSLAHEQGGFMTRAQIESLAPPPHAIRRLLLQSVLEREQRGLYRITSAPQSDDSELWRAVLWPMIDRPNDPPAILCFRSALSLYEISTINPNTIDIAVPPATRMRRTTAAPSRIHIHHINIPPTDVTTIRGLRVTTLFRTIADLIVTGRDLQFVDEALAQLISAASITSKDINMLKAMRTLDKRAISLLRQHE